MKTQKSLLVLLICCLPRWTTHGAGPAPAVQHWYTVYATVGAEVKNFTGSSPLNAEDFAAAINPSGYPAKLEHLRAFYRMNDKSGWHEDKSLTAVFIVPSHIVYFYELTEKPKLAEE